MHDGPGYAAFFGRLLGLTRAPSESDTAFGDRVAAELLFMYGDCPFPLYADRMARWR